ncbi:MAG TPA: VWA domain-containing protein [Dehalococcoidia bacterium]|nr:VWA domain-containing protein [Dehalococcoidia bacterium]
MSLADGNWLFALLAVEAIAIGFVWLGLWRRRASAVFAGERAASPGSAAYWVKATLVVIAATLVVIAMARPQWGSREFSRQHEGVDVVIALDISQSMTATDSQPSRLGLAQTQLRSLLEGIRGNRVGLVLFAGSSIVRSPLSTDTTAIATIIAGAEQESRLTRAGSDLGAALDQAARVLEASESPGKAVILVSDGEDHVGNAVQKAAELGAKGITVFAAGVGSPQGSTLVERVAGGTQTRLKVDASGQPVITRLNENVLRSVAAAGGGRYLRLDSTPLLSLRGDLQNLEQTPLAEQTQKVPVERFQIFVIAALAVLVLAWFVPDPLPRPSFRRALSLRPRPALALVAVAALLGACSGDGDSLRSEVQRANRLYEEGRFEEALDIYQRLQAQRPDLPELAYNAGNALHRLERFDRAVAETRRALPPSTIALGAATYYALGNHYLAQRDLMNAFEAYKSALLLNPGDSDAKWNIELVLLLMNRRDQPQAQQQPGPGDAQQQPPDSEQSADTEGPSQPREGQPQGQPSPQQGQDQPSQAQVLQQLREALAGIDEDLTFEEAIRILELLRQRRQAQPQLPSTSPGGLDY